MNKKIVFLLAIVALIACSEAAEKRKRKEPVCAYSDEDKNWHPNQQCVIHCFEKHQNVGCTSATCSCEGVARSPHFGDTHRPRVPQ